MADFLEGYGVADARRERAWKWIIGAALAAVLLGATGWFLLRDFREERQAKRFFELLEKKDYQAAYRLWGCDEQTPCRDYSMARFLEDWGPDGVYGNLSRLELGRKRSCETGIIQYLEYGPDETVHLWVNRGDLTLSFSPWPVCNPRWQAPTE